jgi:hypothetical protein
MDARHRRYDRANCCRLDKIPHCFQDASHGRYDALPPRKTVDRLNDLILIMRAVVNVTRGS